MAPLKDSAPSLRFGIPSLDELFDLQNLSEKENLPDEGASSTTADQIATKKRDERQTAESYAIVGADGSGKSVLALHMAARYHADCWFRTSSQEPSPEQRRTPRILYVSSDLKIGSALKVWENFGLDNPYTRHIPFERIPDSMRRYSIEAEKGYGKSGLSLQPLRPTDHEDDDSLIKYLLPDPGKDAPRVGFLDLATYTAGDDWNFVNSLLAKLKSIPTAQMDGDLLPHLVIIDSVLGFETFVGRLDAYGTEQTRRARIAQCMRNAGTHCHLAFVVEEPHEEEHLPEEYVTDVVVRLRQRKRADAITRTLEIEKARARNHSGGEHPFEIRNRQGSSSRGWENADMPVAKNDYVHVLHSIPHRSNLVARYEGVDLLESSPASFGIEYLDDILARGLLPGTCNALIGDASTGKSALAERFLAEGFRHLISHFIHVFARFQDNRDHDVDTERRLNRSWDWVLTKLRASVLDAQQDAKSGYEDQSAVREAVGPPERAELCNILSSAIRGCEEDSVGRLKDKEYPLPAYPWIATWADPNRRLELMRHLDPLRKSPQMRIDKIFALGPRKIDPEQGVKTAFDPNQGAEAVLELFNHPNLRCPAVLLTTSNKRAKEVAIDCLVHHSGLIIGRCVHASAIKTR